MGRCKTLLPIDGVPMLERVLHTVGCVDQLWPIVVVTGHQPDQVRPIIRSAGAIEAHNPHYALGEMISSIKTGVREMRDGVDAFFIMLADQPRIRAETLGTLASTWRARRPNILLPRYNNRRGHPVVITAAAIGEIISLPPDATLKTFTSRHASTTLQIDVDDPAILDDIDTPADYARTLQQHRIEDQQTTQPV